VEASTDPWVLAQIERAVAPYVGKLPAQEIEWMRKQLAEAVSEKPSLSRLLRRARPPVVDESGEVRRDDVPGTPATRKRVG
jgi:hypothetical protein